MILGEVSLSLLPLCADLDVTHQSHYFNLRLKWELRNFCKFRASKSGLKVRNLREFA